MNTLLPADQIAHLENQLGVARQKINTLLDQLEAQNQFHHLQSTQLQQSSQSRDEFLAAISHEMRTPMNGIMGMVELLLDTKLDTRQRKWTGIIQESGQILLKTISDMLDAASIRAGQFHLEPTPFNLTEQVNRLCDHMKQAAQAKGLEFRCEIAPETPPLLTGDARRLFQILENLLQNAIQFTASGFVSLKISLLEEDRQGLLIGFAVQDSGIGIATGNQARIFEFFEQGNASASKSNGGAGLTLSIAAELARMMGGEIRVESKEGEGSTFSFTARLQRMGSKDLPLVLSREPGGMVVRVLVIESDEKLRRSLAANLRGWGLRVEEAVDPEDAFHQILTACKGSDPFRVIVVEGEMRSCPEGRFLFEALAADQKSNGTRIACLTRESTTDEDGPESNWEILVKPVGADSLYQCMQNLLGCTPDVEPNSKEVGKGVASILQRKGSKILVVEDEPVTQMIATVLLKKLGLVYDVVGDVQQAEKAFGKSQYDLVLLGLHHRSVPQISFPGVPVVTMSPRDVTHGVAYGVDQIFKPLDLEQLATTLNKWL